MACNAQEDEFDQLDKPGAERSRRRRATNEEWDSDLEDDLLSDDWGLSKKNQSDQSDEELDDNLLQSDDEGNESYQDVSIDMNASASFVGTSLELSKSIGDKSSEEVFHYADNDIDDENATLEVAEDAQEEMEGYVHDEYADEEEGVEYEDGTQLGDDQIDYPAEQGEEMYNDEVLDLEINDPLDDEFQGTLFLHNQDEDYTQFYATDQDMPEDLQTQDNEVYEEATAADTQEQVVEVAQEPEEVVKQIQEIEERKEVSDDEDEDDEESGRMRFKTERKEGTVIRLTDAARKRRNIPDTLELSDEAKAALREFEETERQRKQGKRGRRGGPSANFPFCDPRRESGRRRDQRPPLMQVPPSLQSPRTTMNSSEHQSGRGTLQQRRQPPPLLVPQRHPSTSEMPSGPPQQPEQQEQQNSETASVGVNSTVIPTQQPKNIHINPHFRGPVVTPVQVPLMPTPNQPRPAVGPQRFLSPPEFQPPIPVPANFNQPPRLPLQEPWRGPHPQEREPFFIGEPRFQGQHVFEQGSPPPPLMNNHAMSLQPPMVYSHPGSGFNQQGQHHMFPREAPIRTSLQPQGHMGMSPFNQPGPLNPRPFIPPRQQFPQGPGQPFPPSPHIQQNLQPPLQLQPLPQHQHNCSPQPIIPNAPHQFRPHLQILPTSVNDKRLQRPQRQNIMKPRHNIPGIQNMNKLPNQFQTSVQRNSNLRELPIAPHNSSVRHHRPLSAPAAQTTSVSGTKPTASIVTSSRVKQTVQSAPTLQGSPGVRVPQKNLQQKIKKQKPMSQDSTVIEPTDEDEETRVYRLKIEEQKKLREEILKQKELRRQQQAGARKKELLERLAQQQQQQPPAAQQLSQPINTSQAPQNINTSTLQAVSLVQPNIKNRLFTKKQVTGTGTQQQFIKTHQTGNVIQVQAEMKKNINQIKPIRPAPLNPLQFPKVVQSKPINLPGSSMQCGKVIVPSVKTPELKPGVKRTVMQRMNSGGGDGPHINPKIRVLKLPTMQGSENTGFSHPEVQSQQRQHQQHLQKQQPVRKVTLTKGAQQPQQRPQQQRQQSVPQLLGMTKNSANQQNRVIMQGRGTALPGQMGRGRMMQHKQNLRVVECRPQPCVVSIEGLSSSTTDFQLKNLLMSVGPIQDFKMMREQRKAIAKFREPAHASAFQQKFHRHMIDLSHINVALIMDE
ncbi:RNA-binding protein 33 isoform X1 [Hemiscyllium ocellatum]|uniref:RNA-binding protein 33 isoform X1 n=1 Tax=Hemiscyllium ocellatum TaxID=170820 RepID=UPI002966D8E4|nr:RNA-binding protein 33 isoform X1 [Hemiscyllium ocellatum]